jgi:alkylation response protein AidB-like acyl-CoA dehydrogenase
MAHRAPVDDLLQALRSAADLPALIAEGVLEIDEDTVRAVLEEAGKFGGEVLDPLNAPGDRAGCRLVDGQVETPPGWKEAYRQFAAGGWPALAAPERWGGQHLPQVLASAAGEIWNGANLAFGLCPLLTLGAVDALEAQGSAELKRLFLPKMVAGEWTGTMNLTEPQAGSDLGALKTRAVRQADGSYRLFGTKIFITYGDHDMTANIVHLVLARLPDAPAGTRGISLFAVPKYLVGTDGAALARNDVVVAGIEHKLGIHASPTCVMKFGEREGAVGYLVGEENRGLAVMFIMMNAARLAVGVQGVAVAERATQQAIAYARERRQGRASGDDGADMVPIIAHPDIRRSLLTMRALTQAARCICLLTAKHTDVAQRARDARARAAASQRVALLTPVAKAFATDVGCEVASIGVQVHGGMGFIEETGAAQIYRDARILPIYEGTNGIQAIDLVTRKLPLAGGEVVAALLRELQTIVGRVRASNRAQFGRMGERLDAAVSALEEATRWMVGAHARQPDAALAGATPYLRLFGLAAGGTYLAKAALASDGEGASAGAVTVARFFAENLATAAPALKESIVAGAEGVLAGSALAG